MNNVIPIVLPKPRQSLLRDLCFNRLIRAVLQALDLAQDLGVEVVDHVVFSSRT